MPVKKKDRMICGNCEVVIKRNPVFFYFCSMLCALIDGWKRGMRPDDELADCTCDGQAHVEGCPQLKDLKERRKGR